ncbi:hypothetical protein BH10PLA2_BH10PLA2_34410 [soil metagenome]
MTEEWSDKWQSECEKAAFNSAALLRLAGRRVTHSATIEILISAPRGEGWILDANTSAFARCATAAAQRFELHEKDLFFSVIDYFDKELATMRPGRRAMLEASIRGTLVGQGMGSP